MIVKANVYYRLSEIMALLLSERYRGSKGEPVLSINRISEITGVPVGVLRNDIICLCEDDNIKSSMCLKEDFDTNTWIKSLKKREKVAFDMCIGIEGEKFLGLDLEDAFFVNLTPFEKNVFASVIKQSDISDAIWIKYPPLCAGKDEVRLIARLQMAIEQKKKVSFIYEEPDKKELFEKFCPRILYETLEDKEMYVVGFAEDGKLLIKRLAYIKELKELNEQIPPIKEGDLEILDYLWGTDISSDEVLHVKIKIFKETKNIFEKIKTETNARKYGRIYDDPNISNVAYYEDEVCGMKAFMRWLMGYGASVLVLEPRSLAEAMYESALRKLRLYEEGSI